jgi:hypothetical protein
VPTDEIAPYEQAPELDPSVALSVTLAELELLRTQVTITMSQVRAVPDEPAIHDLSPLGQRPL